MKINKYLIVFVLLLGLALVPESRTQYSLKKSVLGNGGTEMSNETYKVNGTLSQISIGASSNSEYQAFIGFWYGNNIFPAPKLLSPADSSRNQPISLQLQWLPVSNADGYTLEVSTSEDFSNIVITEEELSGTTFSLSGLNFETRYYWRVQAYNETKTSAWSDVWEFLTTRNVPQDLAILDANVLLSGLWNGTAHKAAPVIIELRSGSGLGSSQLYKRAAGIINEDGVISVSFTDFASGDYWLIIRTSGYLPIASQQRITVSSGQVLEYDFSRSASSTYQNTMQVLSNGRYLMKAGDFDANRRVQSTDTGILKGNIGGNNSIIPAMENQTGTSPLENGNTVINSNVLLAGLWSGSSHKTIPIIVELRSGSSIGSSQLYKRTSGIIDANGIVSVSFDEFVSSDYWLVIRATGYLPIASQQRITVSSGQVLEYDFSRSASSTYQNTMQVLSNGRYLMKAGDFDANRRVQTTDTGILKGNIGGNNSIIPAE